MKTRFCFWCAILCLGSVCARTQSPVVPSVDIRFHVVLLGRDPEPPRLWRGDRAEVIAMQSFDRVGPYAYRGPRRMRFVRPVPATVGGAAATYSPAGDVEIPLGGGRDWLLLLTPERVANGDPPTYRIVAVDDSRSGYGAGQLVIYNSLPVALEAVSEGRRWRLLPGTPSVLTVGSGSEVRLECFVTTAEGPQMVFGAELSLPADHRGVLVLLAPRRPGVRLLQSYLVLENLVATAAAELPVPVPRSP